MFEKFQIAIPNRAEVLNPRPTDALDGLEHVF
jgi:hypothetical protein